ncbi:MAG: hypothetical protein KAR79_01855 [Simkaniaceae bacterium]|nr:hypothetical protein [Simkaniaceae bacterium]
MKQIRFFHRPVILHLTCLLVTFLLYFPKGGFIVGSIPIYWGYFCLAALGAFFASKRQYLLTKERVLALLCLIPFQAVAILAHINNGTTSSGLSFAFLINIIALPYIFLLFLSEALEKIDYESLINHLRRGIFFICFYGICLFFSYLFLGKIFEIPLLTSTFGDAFAVGEKCNNRGLVMKLTSTYNNGNIFGICLLMLMPIYKVIEKNIFKRGLVTLAALLTLSRTVWVGLIFVEIGYAFYLRKNRNPFIKLTLFFILFLVLYLIFIEQFHFNWSFLFDKTFGGRSLLFPQLSELTFFPSEPFVFTEPVYFLITLCFGMTGLACYLLGMTAPLFIFTLNKNTFRNTSHSKALFLGLLSFLFVSISDGAICLNPVLAIYWFLTSLLLRKAHPQFSSLSETRPVLQ